MASQKNTLSDSRILPTRINKFREAVAGIGRVTMPKREGNLVGRAGGEFVNTGLFGVPLLTSVGGCRSERSIASAEVLAFQSEAKLTPTKKKKQNKPSKLLLQRDILVALRAAFFFFFFFCSLLLQHEEAQLFVDWKSKFEFQSFLRLWSLKWKKLEIKLIVSAFKISCQWRRTSFCLFLFSQFLFYVPLVVRSVFLYDEFLYVLKPDTKDELQNFIYFQTNKSLTFLTYVRGDLPTLEDVEDLPLLLMGYYSSTNSYCISVVDSACCLNERIKILWMVGWQYITISNI